MQRPDSGSFVVRAPRCLAVNGHHFPFASGGHGLDPANEAFLERRWFEDSKDARKSVMRWNAVLQFQKRLEPFFFTSSELFHLREVFGSANRGQNRNRNDVKQRMFLAPINSRLRQVGEIFQQRWCL